MPKTIIGVMGGGSASEFHLEMAYNLGKMIATQGWALLNGGRNCGIMEASAKGASTHGGLTIGILPDKDDKRASKYIDILIKTGAGDSRNYFNILSSELIIACPGGPGTISEIALALKNHKHVILLDFDIGALFDSYKNSGLLVNLATPEEAIEKAKSIIASGSI